VTADTARENGLPVHIVADPHTVDGLIEALVMVLDQRITSDG
jgi:uroporphyrinogen-III synthase